ncbi:MAG: acetylornithine deacetylase [Cyanothece sp. SIO1E1]|nr:acetylornithine deacetylase [Cyanothece sp. SIO1E1]
MPEHPLLSDSIHVLEQLVAHPVLGGQSNLSIAHFIGNFLEQAGIDYQYVTNEDGNKKAIHCRIGPAVDGGVILSGHTDVVPTDGQDWHTDPFQLTAQGDLLYGRGATDMKGFIACCLAALPRMKNAGLAKPIYFAFSYDEEIGCLSGPIVAKAIREHYDERPAFAIIGEPTSMNLANAEKGMGVFETTIYSRAGHSSQIRSGASAIQEAAKLILWLEDKIEALIADGHTDDRFSPPHSTLQAGICHGGLAPNIIADQCHIQWDLRIIPKDDWQEILQDFLNYCQEREKSCRDKVPEFRIETVPQYPFVPALDTSPKSAVVEFTRPLVSEPSLTSVAFASEAGQFAAEGFEAVLCGPGHVGQCHIANEYIEREQLDQCLHFMDRLIEQLSS